MKWQSEGMSRQSENDMSVFKLHVHVAMTVRNLVLRHEQIDSKVGLEACRLIPLLIGNKLFSGCAQRSVVKALIPEASRDVRVAAMVSWCLQPSAHISKSCRAGSRFQCRHFQVPLQETKLRKSYLEMS